MRAPVSGVISAHTTNPLRDHTVLNGKGTRLMKFFAKRMSNCISIAVLTLASLGFPIHASAKSSLEHISRSGSVSVITGDSASRGDVILTDLFDIFHFVEREELACDGSICKTAQNSLERICWRGDIRQICTILETLSARADAAYDAGLHQRSTLARCTVHTKLNVVRATIQMMSDYERKTVATEQDMLPCRGTAQ